MIGAALTLLLSMGCSQPLAKWEPGGLVGGGLNAGAGNHG
jgi:hypothetical protein